MRELAVLTFQSLDGVMQGPTSPEEDPSNGFTAGGWATPYWDDVMQQVAEVAFAEPYDMLFGRTTYDMFAANWPDQTDANPTASMMNAAKKLVVTSSTTRPLPWRNSELVTGDAATAITALKSQSGRLLQVHGSHGLIQTLLANDLIDEFRLWTFPVVLGFGKRLFERGAPSGRLRLTRTGSTSQGVVLSVYRRLR